MATDGVKIIDGDLAHDTYWGIMDLYDSGVEIEEIRKEMPFEIDINGDDFSIEVFVTSYALAFWELGAISNEILGAVKSVMTKGACVRSWTESYGEKAGKARQRELEKLWHKINLDNSKIRNRKKYRKVSHFHFNSDDLLVFKTDDGSYRAVICASIEQYRGECSYVLVPTTISSKIKPTPEDLMGYDIAGHPIGARYEVSKMIQMQPGVENLWCLYPIYEPFFFGLVQLGISHKNMVGVKPHLEKVGTLKIKEGFKRTGIYSVLSNIGDLVEIFRDIDSDKMAFGKRFPVRLVCELEG
jgi:hypothetical protein